MSKSQLKGSKQRTGTSNSGQDRTNKDIQPAWQRPKSWDYGREVIVDDAKSKPSYKTTTTKHGWDYELRVVTDDVKNKSSEMEIILEMRVWKQTQRENVTTMGGNVNHLVELEIASLTTESLKNDEYTPKNYPDSAWSTK